MLAALPDLGAVAAALLLLLIAAALWVLTQLLVNSLGKAPLIGGWISGTLAGWLNDARNAVLRGASASWHAAVDMLNWANNLFVTMLVKADQFMGQASAAISRLAYVRIPEMFAQAVSYALGLYHSAVSYAQTLRDQALAYADSRVTALESTVQGWVSQALVYAARLASGAEAYALALARQAEIDAANLVTEASSVLRADITAAEQLAARDFTTLEAWAAAGLAQLGGDLTAGLATAEALAFSQVTALGRGIVTDLEQTGNAAIHLAWPDVTGDIEALRGVLGADFPWLKDLTSLLAGAGATGLLAALIQSLAGTQAITRLAADCIVPNCRNLSGLGQFLQSLFADATDVALFAWLAEAVANPAGWAADTHAVVGSIATDTAGAARTLLGV